MAHTANTGREHFAHRRGRGRPRRRRELREDPARICRRPGRRGGAQRPDRRRATAADRLSVYRPGRPICRHGPGPVRHATTFRQALDACAEHLRPHLDRSLLSLLDPQAGTLLDQTGYTQPVMFAIEYALATLWRSWGIEPAAVMGHSVGEFAAACIAGVFSLEDGLKLIAERARLMQSLPPGGLMAAVFATEPQVTAALQACRGPGDHRRLERAAKASSFPAMSRPCANCWPNSSSQGIRSKTLATSHAFHSQRMDPILDPLRPGGRGGVLLAAADRRSFPT